LHHQVRIVSRHWFDFLNGASDQRTKASPQPGGEIDLGGIEFTLQFLADFSLRTLFQMHVRISLTELKRMTDMLNGNFPA
jgi:hypothetical protein